MKDRDLLWKAYPDGYLAMRGVLSVDGWECCSGPPGILAYVCRHRATSIREIAVPPTGTTFDMARQHIREGDLLPNVDPADTATWACLLRDLLYARAGDVRKGQHGLFLQRDWPPGSSKIWVVGYMDQFIRVTFPLPRDIDTDDPGLALVLARIELRERTTAKSDSAVDLGPDWTETTPGMTWRHTDGESRILMSNPGLPDQGYRLVCGDPRLKVKPKRPTPELAVKDWTPNWWLRKQTGKSEP